MKVILYIPPGSDPKNSFLKIFTKIVPSSHMRIFNRFEYLSKELVKSAKDIILAVFLINDAKEISRFLSMGPILSGLRIILVLPDRKKETLDQAYKLYPRYICEANNQYKELSLIVEKITKNISINFKEEL